MRGLWLSLALLAGVISSANAGDAAGLFLQMKEFSDTSLGANGELQATFFYGYDETGSAPDGFTYSVVFDGTEVVAAGTALPVANLNCGVGQLCTITVEVKQEWKDPTKVTEFAFTDTGASSSTLRAQYTPVSTNVRGHETAPTSGGTPALGFGFTNGSRSPLGDEIFKSARSWVDGSGNLVKLEITTNDMAGTARTYDVGDLTADVTGITPTTISFVRGVEKVKIHRDANGFTCGVSFVGMYRPGFPFSYDGEIYDQIGCAGASTFDVPSSGYFNDTQKAFASLSSLQVAGGYYLYVWEYGLYQPEIISWTPKSDSVDISYYVYWQPAATTGTLTRAQKNTWGSIPEYPQIPNSGDTLFGAVETQSLGVGDLASVTAKTGTATITGVGGGVPIVPCSPFYVNLDYPVDAGSIRRKTTPPGTNLWSDGGYDPRGYNLWTRGYATSLTDSWGTLGTATVESSEYAYNLPLAAEPSDVANRCYVDYPKTPLEGASNAYIAVNFLPDSVDPNGELPSINGIYINGQWLGSSAQSDGTVDGSPSTSEQQISDDIVSVRVYTRTREQTTNDPGSTLPPGDGLIVGLRFNLLGGGSIDFGSVSGVGATSTLIDSTGVSTPVLSHLDVASENNEIKQITGVFAQAAPPCIRTSRLVKDVDDDSVRLDPDVFSADVDADLYELIWYNPTPTSYVYLELTGKFLSDNQVMYLKVDANQPDRGEYNSAIVHSLIAANTYQSKLSTRYDSNSVEFYSLQTVPTHDFTTPNGVQVACAQNGSYFATLVEYEAIPQPVINFESVAPAAAFTGGVAGTLSATAAQSQFSVGYFNYIQDIQGNHASNIPDYPRAQHFFGYPTGIVIYWQTQDGNGNPSVDTCIRGIAITTRGRDPSVADTITWLAGNQAEADDTTNYQKSSVDLSGKVIQSIQGTLASLSSNDCVSEIKFTYETSGNSGCLGPAVSDPATGCDNPLISRPDKGDDIDAEFGLYSLTVGSNADGDFIYSLAGDYAQVDLPQLISLDRSNEAGCTLTRVVDYNYIRDTYYYFSYDIATNDGVCATTQQILNEGDQEATASPYQQKFSNHEVVYGQKVTRIRDDPSAKTFAVENTGTFQITRLNGFEVHSFCYYDAVGQVSASYATKEEDPYFVSGVNEFQFRLNFYSDDTFNTRLSGAPTVVIDEPIYVEAGFADSNVIANAHVVARTCWATRTEDPAGETLTEMNAANVAYWPIETDTCAVDATFERLISTPGSVDQFKFDAFAWYVGGDVSADVVWVHCEVRACPTELSQSYCNLETCDPVTNSPVSARRQRRAIAGEDHMNGYHSKLVSSPLIFLSKKQAKLLEIERDPAVGQRNMVANGVSGFAGVFSMFVTAMMFLVMVVGFRVYKARRAFIARRYEEARC